MLDRETSLRLSLLRFPLIVGVVFVHAYSAKVGFADGQVGLNENFFVVDFIRNFISQVFARIGSPLFLLISGYLFFARNEWSEKSYIMKVKSRVKTLLIPFIFWNIATLLLIMLAQVIPATKIFFSGASRPIADFELFDYLNAITGFNGSPIAYQFWFIRDLMIMVLLAPLINIIIQYAPLQFLCIALLCWLMNGWSITLLYFSVGAYLGRKNFDIFYLDRFGVMIVSLYLVIAVFDVLTINEIINPFLHRVGIAIGVLGALFTTKLIAQNEHFKLLLVRLSGASFFVYAIHEPFLTVLKKILYKLLHPESSLLVLLLYFFIPTIVIFFSLAIFYFLKAKSPGFIGLITGGRQ